MAVRATASRSGFPQPLWRTAVLVAAGVLGVIVIRNVFVAAHQVLGWAVAASLIALYISPVVRRLDRALPKPVAAVASALFLLVAIAGVAFVYSVGVRDEVGRLKDRGPAIAEAIEQRDDRIGTIAGDIGLADQVTDITERLAESVGTGGDSLRSAALSAPSYLVTFILAIFLIVFGGDLVRGGLDQLPDEHRDRYAGALPEASHRTQVYLGASLVQAVVNGVGVYIGAELVDAPAAGLLALFAATLAMLPYLGITLGWLPLIVLGVGLVPLYGVALLALAAIALQVVEARFWRPRIDAKTLHLGSAIPIVTAVLGYAVYGIGGALCATGAVVFLVALVDQLTNTETLPTPLDEMA